MCDYDYTDADPCSLITTSTNIGQWCTFTLLPLHFSILFSRTYSLLHLKTPPPPHSYRRPPLPYLRTHLLFYERKFMLSGYSSSCALSIRFMCCRGGSSFTLSSPTVPLYCSALHHRHDSSWSLVWNSPSMTPVYATHAFSPTTVQPSRLMIGAIPIVPRWPTRGPGRSGSHHDCGSRAPASCTHVVLSDLFDGLAYILTTLGTYYDPFI